MRMNNRQLEVCCIYIGYIWAWAIGTIIFSLTHAALSINTGVWIARVGPGGIPIGAGIGHDLAFLVGSTFEDSSLIGLSAAALGDVIHTLSHDSAITTAGRAPMRGSHGRCHQGQG